MHGHGADCNARLERANQQHRWTETQCKVCLAAAYQMRKASVEPAQQGKAGAVSSEFHTGRAEVRASPGSGPVSV